MLVFISLILIILAAISEAIMDTLQFHYDKSIFKSNPKQYFWNPLISWANKYKQDLKTPRFIGSTSLFVFATDAWHLFKFIRTSTIFISIGLIALITDKLLMVAFYVIVLRIVFGICFTCCFNKYLLIKNELQK